MLRLALHGQGELYRDEAVAILGSFSGDLSLYGVHGIEAGLAVEETITEPLRIRIAGPLDSVGASALRRAAANAAWPWTLVETGPAETAPQATLSFGGVTRQVDDPELLPQAIRELVGGGSS
jgi:hypothetical protein